MLPFEQRLDFYAIAKELGCQVLDVKMKKNEQSEKPISKEEWDSIRLEQLKSYIMRCSILNESIDQKLFNEYNSLVKK